MNNTDRIRWVTVNVNEKYIKSEISQIKQALRRFLTWVQSCQTDTD